MKKIISTITIILLLTLVIFTGKTYAAALTSVSVDTDKTLVHPGEEVKVTMNFGENLGAYTVDFAYDDAIFEYVSVEGGTANDTGDKVKVTYFDSTGGTNPRTNVSVTFRAKSDITTSNPTEFSLTAEGMANADASVTYDDITTPIVKNVTVEPQYVDYTLKLEHTGDIVKGEEKEMILSYSSSMGRYHEHARLVAEAITPTGASVKLLATDQALLEHDIIQSGWGDAQGYKIGGKDFSQVLNVRGVFSEAGDYTITLKLIDRDNSDSVIAQQEFKFTAVEEQAVTPPTTTPSESVTPPAEEVENATQVTPSELPKTGINLYVPIVVVLIALLSFCVYFNRKK
ncbi:MAG: hypothetical protein IJE05_03110 [Clostridia bacterium]|nr:hypothetical protein [Clostridia bacterium]